VEVAKVVSKKLAITVRLPGELQPYEGVAVYPKVTAFVDSIRVDRGSVVKAGQPMAQLAAPEIAAQRAEAQSKLQGAESAAWRGRSQAGLGRKHLPKTEGGFHDSALSPEMIWRSRKGQSRQTVHGLIRPRKVLRRRDPH